MGWLGSEEVDVNWNVGPVSSPFTVSSHRGEFDKTGKTKTFCWSSANLWAFNNAVISFISMKRGMKLMTGILKVQFQVMTSKRYIFLFPACQIHTSIVRSFDGFRLGSTQISWMLRKYSYLTCLETSCLLSFAFFEYLGLHLPTNGPQKV